MAQQRITLSHQQRITISTPTLTLNNNLRFPAFFFESEMQLQVHTVDTWPTELLLVIKASNGRVIRASHARYVPPPLCKQNMSARSLLRRRHRETNHDSNDDERNDDERNHDETRHDETRHDETRHAHSLHGIPLLRCSALSTVCCPCALVSVSVLFS